MRAPRSSSNAVSLDWRVVLGLVEPSAPGWDRVRGAQVTELIALLPMICLTNMFNGAVLAAILWGSVPDWQILAWLTAIIAIMASAVRLKARTERNLFTGAASGAVARSVLRATLLGAIWAIPPAFFAGSGTIEQQLAICLVSAAVIASATLTTSVVPPAMLAFIAIASAGLTVMMAHTASPLLGFLPLTYAGSLALGGTASGRAFLSRKWAEVSLAEKDEVVSLLLRETGGKDADWLWQIDPARRLCEVQPRLARAAAREPAALEGLPLLRLLAGEAWEAGRLSEPLGMMLDKLNAREAFADLELPVQIAGEIRWWRLSAAPRFDEADVFRGFRGVGSDVTEERRAAEEKDRLARFDPMTGLANRAHFTDALRKTLARAFRDSRRCALMLIDLDRFKAVNDTLGHPVGDALLKAAAIRLSALAGEDDVCARLGGDEFAMILADADDIARVDAMGRGIITALTAPFEINGSVIRIGGSVGTALGPRDGRSIEMLLRNADLALYRAKEEGRGLHRRFAPSYLARVEKRRAIELALREALDNEQLRLVYEPIVALKDGKVAGFEAQLRWRHPELGEIAPAEFLPIAEEARLTTRIGAWALRTACAEAENWPKRVRLHVDLGPDQLLDPQLPALLLSALSHSGLAPHRLELEIAEPAFQRDPEAAIAAIDRLRAIGVRVALDEFGAGACSLDIVRSGRFATIKLAGEVVRSAAAETAESVALIRAVVAMAETLGIDTDATGANSDIEQALAQRLGCRQIQGEAAGGTVPAEAARALVAKPAARRVA